MMLYLYTISIPEIENLDAVLRGGQNKQEQEQEKVMIINVLVDPVNGLCEKRSPASESDHTENHSAETGSAVMEDGSDEQDKMEVIPEGMKWTTQILGLNKVK